MPVAGFDHVAITVADVEATVRCYERVLGATPLLLDRILAGELPIPLQQVGPTLKNIHPASAPAAPHADAPTTGSADLCFRYAGTVAQILDELAANEVPVVDGPVPRPASNGDMGTSVYFRDPDGNLLELLTLDG
jgi:catechol 2,3-dioxygenase-like lactoylglutathione lyase family enzyme